MQALLDCRGLSCPLPLVRMSRAMKTLAEGDVLVVTADDPAFLADVSAWVEKVGHVIVAFDEAEGAQRVVVRKA